MAFLFNSSYFLDKENQAKLLDIKLPPAISNNTGLTSITNTNQGMDFDKSPIVAPSSSIEYRNIKGIDEQGLDSPDTVLNTKYYNNKVFTIAEVEALGAYRPIFKLPEVPKINVLDISIKNSPPQQVNNNSQGVNSNQSTNASMYDFDTIESPIKKYGSVFGNGQFYNPNNPSVGRNVGVDYGTGTGQEDVSPFTSGEIIKAGYLAQGSGNSVTIKSRDKQGKDIYQIFEHLDGDSIANLKVGDRVTTGQIIGKTGMKGRVKENSDGNHLSFRLQTTPDIKNFNDYKPGEIIDHLQLLEAYLQKKNNSQDVKPSTSSSRPMTQVTAKPEGNEGGSNQSQILKWADIYSAQAGVPANILKAMIAKESVWNPNAINKRDQADGTDSIGLGQMGQGALADINKDNTMGAKYTTADLLNPEIAVKTAAYYLKNRINTFGGNLREGIKGYNGSGWEASQYADDIIRESARY